jgi:hypothetical protein
MMDLLRLVWILKKKQAWLKEAWKRYSTAVVTLMVM